MTQVNKISEIKSAGSYMYMGAVITVNEITSSKKLKGVCRLADGTEFTFTNGASNLLYRIEHNGKSKPRTDAGAESKVTIPTKVDNSQAHGIHKVVSVSGNKLARQHRRIMDALTTINEVLGYQDGANMLIQAAWYEYASEQKAIAEAAAKAKAEAEAKAKAEAEAKAEADRLAQREADIQSLMRIMKMTREQAEAAVDAQ